MILLTITFLALSLVLPALGNPVPTDREPQHRCNRVPEAGQCVQVDFPLSSCFDAKCYFPHGYFFPFDVPCSCRKDSPSITDPASPLPTLDRPAGAPPPTHTSIEPSTTLSISGVKRTLEPCPDPQINLNPPFNFVCPGDDKYCLNPVISTEPPYNFVCPE